MISLDLRGREPIFVQIEERICEMIALGAISPGEQLPPVRTLARQLGINPNTVQKAYQELERRGMVVSLGGKGSFVASQNETQQRLQEQAEMDLKQAATDAARRGVALDNALNIVKEAYSSKEDRR